MIHHDDEVIIAQCTPRGSGAIALLRLSGAHAWVVANQLAKLAAGTNLIDQQSHTIHFGWVVDKAGTQIDQVLFLLMRSPRTFTGQDTVEITCHNNQFIIAAIIEAAIIAGARLAKEGEFSRRAVLHGKIDLLQAEAINELIQANTSLARKQSLAQVEGSLSAWITVIEKELVRAYAFSEASFEFLEEDVSFGANVSAIIDHILIEIERMQKVFNQQQQIRQGIRIALIGSVNAGKSSLFNLLLAKERAIVSPMPGTTRDTIEAGLYQDGNYWTLVDTAGLRQTDDVIEQQGIERSNKEAALADIVLLVVDRSRDFVSQENIIYQELVERYQAKIILVYNKTDLPIANQSLTIPAAVPVVVCSCADQQGGSEVHAALAAKVSSLLAAIDSPFLLNERQYNLLLSLKQKLDEVKKHLDEPIQYELLSIHIKDALLVLSSLTGKSISEQALDAVFKEFCVGK